MAFLPHRQTLSKYSIFIWLVVLGLKFTLRYEVEIEIEIEIQPHNTAIQYIQKRKKKHRQGKKTEGIKKIKAGKEKIIGEEGERGETIS